MKIRKSLASLAVLTAAVTALPPAALVANGAMAKCSPAMMKKCEVDGVLEAVCRLCADEIDALLADRDRALGGHAGLNLLEAPSLEALSATQIDLDRKLSAYS